MAVLLKTASVRVSFIQIVQIRVQNKGKSVWKSRYVGDVSVTSPARRLWTAATAGVQPDGHTATASSSLARRGQPNTQAVLLMACELLLYRPTDAWLGRIT